MDYSMTNRLARNFISFFLASIVLGTAGFLNGEDLFSSIGAVFTQKDLLLLGLYTFFLIFSAGIFCSLIDFVSVSLLRKRKKLKVINDIILITFSSSVTIFLFFDFKVYKIMGMHLYSPFVFDNLKKTNVQSEIHLSLSTVLSSILLITLTAVSYVILFYVSDKIFRRLNCRKTNIVYAVVTLFLITGSVASVYAGKHVQHIKNESSQKSDVFLFYDYIYTNTQSSGSLELKYPSDEFKMPVLTRKKHIIYIQAESFRSDMFNSEMMPFTYSYSKQNRCITSGNHHSGELSTVYGTFSALYSTNIYYYWFFADKKISSIPLSILKNNGYRLYGGAASGLINWERKAEYMFDIFDEYKEFSEPELKRDAVLSDWVIKKGRDNNNPVFIFMFFNATHHNYFYPPEFEIFKPVIDQNFNYFDEKALKNKKAEIINRYKNAVRYTDYLIEKTIREIKKTLGDDIIVIFSGDHSEELFDTGLLGHGKISNNFRSRVPLMICDSDIEPFEAELSGHNDIFPTVIDLLKPSEPVNHNSYSNGDSLFQKQEEKYIVVSGFDFPKRSREITLINRRGKLLLEKNEDSISTENSFNIIKTMDLNDKPLNDQKDTEYLQSMIPLFEKDILRFFKTR